MALPPPPVRPDPDRVPDEGELRRDLAAAYRLVALHGMSDLVYTHLSVRLPGPGHRFLVNPYGLLFEEVTASSLVVVDAEGEPAQPTAWPVNPAGFVIHSALHLGSARAACVMHTHTLAGMVVAAQAGGLLPLNQVSMEFDGRVAIHGYEGVAADDNLSERERLVRDMGDRPCMILRNHGLLTVGRTVAEAFYWMWYLEQACRIQVAAQSTGAALAMPPPEVVARTRAQFGDGPTKGWLPGRHCGGSWIASSRTTRLERGTCPLAPGRDEALRRLRRGARRDARRGAGRVPHAARALRVGEDDDPHGHRGICRAERGTRAAGRARHHLPCRRSGGTSAWSSRATRCSRT
jgi:ribulose-5-phosphate 4-epimerase/fuculose-1-phosphate aldolase